MGATMNVLTIALVLLVTGCSASTELAKRNEFYEHEARLSEFRLYANTHNPNERCVAVMKKVTSGEIAIPDTFPKHPEYNKEYRDKYAKHFVEILTYQSTNKVTLKQALLAVGDIMLLPDDVNVQGCSYRLGMSWDRVFSFGVGVSYKEVRKWAQQTLTEQRVVLTPYRQAIQAISNSLAERADAGQLTALQYISTLEAALKYLDEQTILHRQILDNNVQVAIARDQEVINGVAIGLGVISTAALAVEAYETYRMANALTYMAYKPIVCSVVGNTVVCN
jgi:hypothetical protein